MIVNFIHLMAISELRFQLRKNLINEKFKCNVKSNINQEACCYFENFRQGSCIL